MKTFKIISVFTVLAGLLLMSYGPDFIVIPAMGLIIIVPIILIFLILLGLFITPFLVAISWSTTKQKTKTHACIGCLGNANLTKQNYPFEEYYCEYCGTITQIQCLV